MLKTMKPLYPKPHRNQLLEGLRSTLKLNTFHRWFLLSVASRTAPNVAPSSAKVEGFSGETTEMSNICNRISAGRDCEWSGKSSAPTSTWTEACVRCRKCTKVSMSALWRNSTSPPFICMLKRGVLEGPDSGQGRRHTESPGRYLGPATT